MNQTHEELLSRYLQLPERLETAIRGLDEGQLDLTLGTGWSIREYTHHTVEGESMWQVFLRAILGKDGIEIPIQWYLAMPQDDWVKRWAYETRAVEPSLALFRASTASLVELLRKVPENAWDRYGCVTWPNNDKESRLSVRDIVLMHLGHMDHHTADIQRIRTAQHI